MAVLGFMNFCSQIDRVVSFAFSCVFNCACVTIITTFSFLCLCETNDPLFSPASTTNLLQLFSFPSPIQCEKYTQNPMFLLGHFSDMSQT